MGFAKKLLPFNKTALRQTNHFSPFIDGVNYCNKTCEARAKLRKRYESDDDEDDISPFDA